MGLIISTLKKIFLRVLVFLLFLALLGIANLVKLVYSNQLFISIVNFLNSSIILLVIIAVIYLAADIFGELVFPLNLPSPIISAVAGLFLVEFVWRLIVAAGSSFQVDFSKVNPALLIIFYNIVFWIIILSGYLKIISKRPPSSKKVNKRLDKIEKKIDEILDARDKKEIEEKSKKTEKKQKATGPKKTKKTSKK